MKLTRRELAGALGAVAAAAQTSSQPAPTPESDLQAARDRVKANAARLSAEPVAITVEPAFQFKP